MFYRLKSLMVPREGVEPSRPHDRRILSPLCLPVPPSGQGGDNVGFLEKKAIDFGVSLGNTKYFYLYKWLVTMDLNKVMLIGRSTTDVEVKKIESTGNSVVNFTVATNRRYKNKDAQLVEESEYHRCVAYGNAADVIGKYVGK